MKSIFFVSFIFFIPFLSLSQNDTINALDEIILLEDFIKKNAVGITPSSKIKTEDLEPYSPIDFASGINQISGVYLLSGALNTNRITIRGIGARTPFGTDQLRLYFNGIPVTNGAGVSTIEAYDFENIGGIEVVKGPKGTTLGANLGGAIVLNTKAPKVGSTIFKNSFTTGSFNLSKNNFSFKHSERNFNLNLSYNYLQTDGFRQNNSFDRDGLLLTSSVRIYPKGKLDFLVNFIDYTGQIPSSINETDFEEDPTRAAANWLAAQGFEDNKSTLVGLSYSHSFNANLKTKTSIFYTYLDHFEPRPFNILDEFTNGFGFRSILEGELFKGNFTLGAELYKDEYNWQTFENLFEENNGNGSLQGNRLSDNKEFRSQLNVFASYNYALTKALTAQFGLSLNSTSFDFRDLFNLGDSNTSAQRDFDAILLPNFGLQYRIKSGQLYTNISRGFSNPGLEETLTPDGVVNPQINQEKGVNYELGAQLNLLKNRLFLNTALYQISITDLIVAERINEDQFIGRNAGKTRHRGIEIDLNYLQKIGDKWSLAPRLSYTYNNHRFIDFVDEEDDFSGNRLAGVPEHRISSGISLNKGNRFTFSLHHQFTDEIPLTDTNDLNSESFNIFGGQLRYQIPISNTLNLTANFGANNLFDTNYARSVLINAVGFGGAQPRFFFPGNGRNYYGGIVLKYALVKY